MDRSKSECAWNVIILKRGTPNKTYTHRWDIRIPEQIYPRFNKAVPIFPITTTPKIIFGQTFIIPWRTYSIHQRKTHGKWEINI